ncbi:unnamed protein product [Pelagomonas calceolata]|uniref:Uncharacterized protein n=2 Tax=Pelagomonas calceolata TaxID=35677 RepID=A0A8J2S493_9STRA|nr:unnamed protein product [Pelagomonas calceolata]
MSSSDSDDDVPLAQMQAQSSSREARDGDGDAAMADAPPPKPPPPPPTGGGSSSDSSDDDVPLSKLQPQKKAAPPKKAPAKKRPPPPPSSSSSDDDDDDDDDDEDSSDSDEPIAKRKPAPRRRSAPKKRVVESSSGDDSGEEEFDFDRDDSDDSDDVPLATLARKKSAGSAKKSPARKPASRKAPTATARSKKQKGGEAEQAFYGTLRGKLLQEFLRRWWYAYDWPAPQAIDKEPEAGFESLVAFPGVHICTLEGDERFGKVQDHRDHATSPCFLNFYKKPSAELKALCLKAFEVQMAQLLKAEPDNERYINKLKREQRDIERVDADKADREAVAAVREYERARK